MPEVFEQIAIAAWKERTATERQTSGSAVSLELLRTPQPLFLGLSTPFPLVHAGRYLTDEKERSLRSFLCGTLELPFSEATSSEGQYGCSEKHPDNFSLQEEDPLVSIQRE